MTTFFLKTYTKHAEDTDIQETERVEDTQSH